jgi:hypothetical protein
MAKQMHNVRLQALQHEVARAALTGVPYDEIDQRVIDPSPISDEEKTALRLFAWSFLPRFELRRMALERLRGLSLQDEYRGNQTASEVWDTPQADRSTRATSD